MTSIIPINPVNPDYPDQSICDLGVGMTEMARWNNAEVFNNYIYEIDEWVERKVSGESPFTCYQPLYNASGWVRDIRPGTYLVCYPMGGRGSGIDGQYYPTGTWVMEFEGSGFMRFGGDIGYLYERVISGPGTKQVTAIVNNTNQEGWQWNLLATDPANPLKPKAIYLSGTNKDDLYRKFIFTWKDSKVIRFMDWQWMNNNSQFSLSGGRAIKVQNADKAFANQLVPGLVFSGTQSGARGMVEDLSFHSTYLSSEIAHYEGTSVAGWAPSTINGIWIRYTPLTSTYFNYYEPINFGFSTVRVCKMVSSWEYAISSQLGLLPPLSGEVLIPPSGGFAGWNPMPGWLDPQVNWWQGDGLGNHKNYAMNSDIRPVPIQKIIQICNTLLCDLWINIPRSLKTVDVTTFVEYINDNLHPSLKVYIEYCNEPWNLAFQDHRHFSMLGYYFSSVQLGGTPGEAGRRAYALKGYERLKISKSILSGTRPVECILNVQSTDVGWGEIVFDWSGLPLDFSSTIDSISIAPYFGNKGLPDQWNTRFLDEFAPLGLTGHPRHVYNLTSGQILDILEFTAVPNAMDTVRVSKAMANQRGYDLAIYECGHHLDNVGFYRPTGLDDTVSSLGPLANAYRAKMMAVHENARMARIYFYYFAQIGALLNYRIPAVHYNSITRFDMGFFWGLLRSYDRPGPKYQAWLFAINQCNESANGPQSGSSWTAKKFTSSKSQTSRLSPFRGFRR